MARYDNKWIGFLNMGLVLSILMIPVIESSLFAPGFGLNPNNITCKSLHGAQQGETCSGILQKFNLDSDVFTNINPNLNCSDVFVGQWLCIAGIVN